MKKYLTHNGNLIYRGDNHFVYRNYTPPGPVFPSIKIGNQIWMSENLSINDGGSGIYTFNTVCPNGVNIGPQTYYSYDAAYRVANSINGWHLPTLTEWEELRPFFDEDAKNARSTAAWQNGKNGTNTLGLNIYPAGRLNRIGSTRISQVGSEGNLWATEGKGIFFYTFGANNWGIDRSTYCNSIRLIKDA